jgi:hypothetical protein
MWVVSDKQAIVYSIPYYRQGRDCMKSGAKSAPSFAKCQMVVREEEEEEE